MTRPRDSQRSKVYTLGDDYRRAVAKATDGRPNAFLDLTATRELVEEMRIRAGTGTIGIRDGRGTRHASGDAFGINLPRWSRTPVTIAHEVAHVLHDRHGGRGAAHGPEFVRIWTTLLGEFTPLSRRELQRMRVARKVKIAAVAACRPMLSRRKAKRLVAIELEIADHQSALRRLDRESREIRSRSGAKS